MVVEDFGLGGLPQHCSEGLVVDRLPAVDSFLGSKTGYFWLSLVGYWGMAGWDGFVVQTPVLMEHVEQGWGLERLAPAVHSRIGGRCHKCGHFSCILLCQPS